jgi:hypothetical protein
MSLVPFALLQPGLRALEVDSPLQKSDAARAALGVVIAVCAVLFVRAKSWLDLVLLGWISLMLYSLHQASEWHVVAILAWLCAPSRGALVGQTRFWFVVCVATLVFHTSVWPNWLQQLF